MQVGLSILIQTAFALASSCPPRNEDGFVASDELAEWTKTAIDGFFPNHDGWDKDFDRSFSRNLTASLNATFYDFETFRAAYAGFKPGLVENYAGTHTHGFYSVVAVPNPDDEGGYVILTGWEGGFIDGDRSKNVNVTNGAFAVVEQEPDCSRKILEWRDATNLG